MTLRRLIRPMTITVCLVLLAVGCAPGTGGGGGGAGEGGEGGQVALRMSTWGNDSRLKLTEEAVTAFEQANPGITVQVENSEFSSYWDKLATQTAGNNAPDVIQMDESYIAAYGGRAALLDLGTQSSVLDLSAMDAKVLDTGKVNDTLVGAPVGVALFSVGVNPELLQKAGLKVPDDKTWTWDDLATMASTVTQKLSSDGVVGMDFFGLSAAEIGVWARQHNQEVFPLEGQTAVTEDTLVSYFEFAKKMVGMKATPPAGGQSEDVTTALDQSRFATNKAAFHLQFHTQIAAFVAASGSDLKLLRLPAQKSGESPRMVNKASMYWSIAARGEHTEEAAKLVSFLMTDPAAVKILKVERGVPAIAEVQSVIEPELDATGKMSLKFAQDLQDEVVPPPQVTPQNASGYSGEVTRIGTDVLFDRKSPADAAQDLLAVIKESSG
jgi:multiple sugar transport system substrate-binding protein